MVGFGFSQTHICYASCVVLILGFQNRYEPSSDPVRGYLRAVGFGVPNSLELVTCREYVSWLFCLCQKLLVPLGWRGVRDRMILGRQNRLLSTLASLSGVVSCSMEFGVPNSG